MLPLPHRRHWRIASILLLGLVLAATMSPAFWFFDSRAKALLWFHHADKWLHGITFMFLAAWFSGLYPRRNWLPVAVGLTAFGFVVEGCQLLVSYRTADWFDIAANTTGIILGLALAAAGLGGWALRVENWLRERQAT